MITEYTRDQMLQWLTEHFEELGYEVEHYDPKYLHARVPLHCGNKYLFTWDKVPGDNDKLLRKFLMEDLGIDWVKNADISKTSDKSKITVADGKNLIEFIFDRKGELSLKIDDGRTYKFTAKKENNELKICNKIDEVVIEITTDKNLSKDGFFPTIHEKGIDIIEASPLRFYQYYFPKAEVFYAYPDYVQENAEFNEFKKVCEDRGIGLLKTSETEIKEEVKSKTLFDEICTRLVETKNNHESIESIIGDHLDSYLHHLVYYPDPNYKRRAIVGRKKEDIRISLMLLKKIQSLKNIKYCEELKKLTSDYLMIEKRDDYNIASDYVVELWKNYLGLEYPNPSIQIKFEEIFLKEYYYREHFIHQFQVFLLGSYIIDKLYDSRPETIENFRKLHKVPMEISWLAASTYHDFNYSTQKYHSWLTEYLKEVLRLEKSDVQNELSKLNLDGATVRENFLYSSEKLINNFCEKYLIDPEKVKKQINIFLYEKIVTNRNHGLISGLTLLKIYNGRNKKVKSIITEEGIEHVALAIALHDEKMWEFFCGCKGYLLESGKCDQKCKNKNKCNSWDKNLKKCEILNSINFENEPLIYLLILCDSAQDEGRVEQESLGIRSTLEEVDINEQGMVLITLVADNLNSYRMKQSEFNRVEQFLNDEKFEFYLKPNKPSHGKDKKFIM